MSLRFLAFVRLPTLAALIWRKYICRGLKPRVRNHKSPGIIVFRLDDLGDVVLTTPLFRELKGVYPGAHCTAVVQAAYAPLLTTNPHIDRVLTMPTGTVSRFGELWSRLSCACSFWKQHLRRQPFDIAISPRWDVDEHLATFLCLMTDAAVRVGYTDQTSRAKRRLNRGFGRAFDICLSAGPPEHEVQRNLRIVEALGGRIADRKLEIHTTSYDSQRAAKKLGHVHAGTKLVVIGIGAQSAGRKWPLVRYAKVIAQLRAHFCLQAVIVCSSTEAEQAAELARLLREPPLILSGSPLRDLCAVLQKCQLFIGNDSGPAHLAAAMGCETLVISRHPMQGDPGHANSPIRFRPLCSSARVLQPLESSGICASHCREQAPHCILNVSVQQVVDAAVSALRIRDHVQPLTHATDNDMQAPPELISSCFPTQIEVSYR